MMDADQLDDNSYMPFVDDNLESYRWSTLIVRTYLNETLYPILKAKIDNMIPAQICDDSVNLNSNNDSFKGFGGLTKKEIELYAETTGDGSGVSCQDGYVNDYVRLISNLEAYNLFVNVGFDYPDLSGITYIGSSDTFLKWFPHNDYNSTWNLKRKDSFLEWDIHKTMKLHVLRQSIQ